MRIEAVTCSGDRHARIIRCASAAAAQDALRTLARNGASAAEVVAIVRDPTFVGSGTGGAWRRVVPELVATAAGAAIGIVLAGPWVGVAVALTLLLLVAALRTGRRGPADPAVTGRRYELVARGDAVGVVDLVLDGR